jgi:hypothetical protein
LRFAVVLIGYIVIVEVYERPGISHNRVAVLLLFFIPILFASSTELYKKLSIVFLELSIVIISLTIA